MNKKKIVLVILALLILSQATAFAADFEIETLKYRDSGMAGYYEIIGEIKNNTSQAYTIVTFNLNVYSADGDLLDVIQLMIQNFPASSKRSFKHPIQTKIPKGARFRLELNTAM